jgi:hypothetical protein
VSEPFYTYNIQVVFLSFCARLVSSLSFHDYIIDNKKVGAPIANISNPNTSTLPRNFWKSPRRIMFQR